MRVVLPVVSLIKEIAFILKLQVDTPLVLCNIFGKPVMPVTVYKDNQGAIALAVSPQIQPRIKHIAIKCHHFRSFVANGDIKIKHIDTKEKTADIFMKPLYSDLFIYLRYTLNCRYVNGILLCKGVSYYAHKAGILVLLL